MLDISDLYAMFQDRYEQQEEIPDWAPRSCFTLRTKAEECYITRVEKRLARKLNYGECAALIRAYRADKPEARPFVQRYREYHFPPF